MGYGDTKKSMEAKAKKLLKKMKTKGWKIHVWENLGWHYRLEHESGIISLSEIEYPDKRYKTRYSCLMSDHLRPSAGGSYNWYDQREYFDPNDAVAGQLELARDFVARMDNIVSEVENIL